MSYVIEFGIKDLSGIRIPKKVVKDFKKEIKPLKKKIKKLEKLSDHKMTVSQLNELKELRNELYNFTFKISDSFYLTLDYDKSFVEGKYFIYWDKDMEMLSIDLEEDVLELYLDVNDFFSGSGSLYNSSNHGWTKELIESLIKEFKCSATFHDLGDEEYGFEDECSRDFEPNEVWKDGLLC